jgi:hypothetical protein
LAFVSFSLTGIARMEGTVAVDVAEVMTEALIAEPRRKITDSGGRQGNNVIGILRLPTATPIACLYSLKIQQITRKPNQQLNKYELYTTQTLS